MTTQFVLVRHATCAQMDDTLLGRHLDVALDEHGVSQCARLAERLASCALAPLIYASPRRRAQQTAAAIATRCKADVRVCPQLDEVDFGHWAGRSFAALALDPTWREWNANRAAASTPAGETIAKVQARALALLETLDATSPHCSIAVVTHGEIIRSIVMHCLDISANHYDRIAIDPASITTLRLRERRIECLNEQPVP